MRKKALLVLLYTVLMSAFGSCLHWLHKLTGFEAETGLQVRGSLLGPAVIAFIAVYVVVLAGWCLWMKRAGKTAPAPALQENGMLVSAAGYVIGVIMLAGAVWVMVAAGKSSHPVLLRILGALALCSALSLPVITQNGRHEGLMSLRGLCSMVPMAFCCFWLIVSYKLHSNDPVVWNYAIEILSICSTMISFYLVAGFAAGRPKPMWTIFCCNLSVFLAAMALADKRDLNQEIIITSAGLFLLLIALIQILGVTKNTQQ